MAHDPHDHHGHDAHGHDHHGHDHAHAAHGHGHGEAHPPSYYIKIWGVLLALLVVSVLGPELGIPILTLVTAFGIAFVKAYLVAKHFMHLNLEQPVIWYFMSTSLVFMVLFFAGTAPDVMNHEGARWTNDAAKAAIERALAEQAAGGGHGHGDAHAPADHASPADHAQPATSGHGEPAPAGGH
jgi:caa(3)-type oxidase subunit IV